jgi:membrane glycosyltransferase
MSFFLLLLLPLPAEMVVYTAILMPAYPGNMAEVFAARRANGERVSKVEAGLVFALMVCGGYGCLQGGVIHQ